MSMKSWVIGSLIVGISMIGTWLYFIIFGFSGKQLTANILQTGQESSFTTGEINTGIENILTQTGSTGSDAIHVWIPSELFHHDIEIFGKSRANNQGIEIFFHTGSYDSYYRDLNNRLINNEHIDIFMIPTDRFQEYNKYGYHVADNSQLQGTFYYLFNELITDSTGTFFPYSLDPLVMFSHHLFSTKSPSFSDIQKVLLTVGSTRKIPLSFGLSDIDIKFLASENIAYQHHFWVLYEFFRGFVENQDSVGRDNFLTYLKDPAVWDYRKRRLLIKDIQITKPLCTLYGFQCIFANNDSLIYFGFLSDDELMQNLFSGYNSIIYQLPTNTNTHLVRGRGFLINKDTPQLSLAGNFMREYLRAGDQRNINLRDNNLSAFNAILDLQLKQERFSFLVDSLLQRKLFNNSTNLQHLFLQSTPFIKLLEGSYSFIIFINNIQRDYESHFK